MCVCTKKCDLGIKYVAVDFFLKFASAEENFMTQCSTSYSAVFTSPNYFFTIPPIKYVIWTNSRRNPLPHCLADFNSEGLDFNFQLVSLFNQPPTGTNLPSSGLFIFDLQQSSFVNTHTNSLKYLSTAT